MSFFVQMLVYFFNELDESVPQSSLQECCVLKGYLISLFYFIFTKMFRFFIEKLLKSIYITDIPTLSRCKYILQTRHPSLTPEETLN